MRKLSRLLNIITITGISLLVFFAAVNYKGYSIYVPEESQTMAAKGSLNILSETKKIKEGDIISVAQNGNEYELHQVTDINEESFLTENDELFTFSKAYIVSTVSVPYIGYVYDIVFGYWKIYCGVILGFAIAALLTGLLCEKEKEEEKSYNEDISIQFLSSKKNEKKEE